MIKTILIIAGLFVAYILCLGIFGNKSEEVKEASKLGMSLKRYRMYQEIDKKIGEYTKAGKTPPSSLFDEVTNMNEWRRFSDYMYAKAKQERQKIYDNYINQD